MTRLVRACALRTVFACDYAMKGHYVYTDPAVKITRWAMVTAVPRSQHRH
jgi:hypothetical protein